MTNKNPGNKLNGKVLIPLAWIGAIAVSLIVGGIAWGTVLHRVDTLERTFETVSAVVVQSSIKINSTAKDVEWIKLHLELGGK